MPVNPITGEWEFEIETPPRQQQLPQQAPPPLPQQMAQPNLQVPQQWAPMGGGGPGQPAGMQAPASDPMAMPAQAWEAGMADKQNLVQQEGLAGAGGMVSSGLLGLSDMMAQGRQFEGHMGAPFKGQWGQTGQPGVTDLMKILSGLGRPGR
jgi:hypothetical protein